MPAVRIVKVMPQAMIAVYEFWRRTFSRLRAVRNVSLRVAARKQKSPASATKMP